MKCDETLATPQEGALSLDEVRSMLKRTLRIFCEMCLTPIEAMSTQSARQVS